MKADNRVSRFPGSKDTEARKRTLASLEPAAHKDSPPIPHKRPALFKQISKEVVSPWERYQKSFKINQAGPGYIVHAKTSTFQEGIIKAVKTPRSELSKIMTKHHRNFVQLQEAFYHDGEIFLLYELLDVSLAQIFGSPLGRLQLFEVAAFSKEILNGVQYIHDALKITHGNLESANILLSVGGAVKIANIGASMLENRDNKDSQSDLQALGEIIVECLEPRAFLRGESLSDTWPPNVSEFVKLTKVQSAQKLLKHDFLQISPGPSCLKPYIRFAREVGAKEVEFVMDR
ncbi:hypothetical protein N7486_001017 [Penicillium sp. IBT 16267x]|nr:hypothetical protein N7486_001017 [Penicillium sp. IBT 16267x]